MSKIDVDKDVAKDMKNNIGATSSVVFCFDTTSSMNRAIAEVRQKLRDLVETMTADIPGLKVGLIAHGDYCDGDNCMKVLDLTDNLEEIMHFINNAPQTAGGCAPECYEFALKSASDMSWPEEGGTLIIIGDDEPHGKNWYKLNPLYEAIDWKEECQKLLAKNIKVFPMQCLFNVVRTSVNSFWEEISGIFNTPLLILDSFNDSSNVLEAVAYASAGKASYDMYNARFAAEVSAGLKVCSANFSETITKLDLYATNVVDPKDE